MSGTSDEGFDMSDQHEANEPVDDSDEVDPAAAPDPTSTDHPAGEDQAAENRENESPS